MKYRARVLSLYAVLSMVSLLPLHRAVGETPTPHVSLLQTPDEGIQPQVVTDSRGTVHLLYYKGDPGAGDLYYATLRPGQTAFSRPLRVNH